jgi:hypothetical protein
MVNGLDNEKSSDKKSNTIWITATNVLQDILM